MATSLHRGTPEWGREWWHKWLKSGWIFWQALLNQASRPLNHDGSVSAQVDVLLQRTAPTLEVDAEFVNFYGEFKRPIYGYVRRMVDNDEAAIDITQETFFRAWQHFSTIRTYSRPQTWLYPVATHLSFNQRRDHSIPFSRLFTQEPQDGEETSYEREFVDPLNIEAQTVARDMIARALSMLPKRERATLLLRVVHDSTFAEIGVALNLSEVAVRKVLSRARERFRMALVALEDDA